MKVVILCGGKGTRLREETEFRPKPMVSIGDRPILWHIMKIYASYGHTDFVLCLGYKGSIIKSYFRDYLWNTCDVTMDLGRDPKFEFHNRHSEEDWRLTLADTGEESMTAYRIRSIRKYLGDDPTFLLTYGDGVGNVDIKQLLAFHQRMGKVCTLTGVHPLGRFGELRLNDEGVATEFNEKPQTEGAYINGGFMACDTKRFFDYLPDDPGMMLEQAPMRNLCHDGNLAVFRHEGFWQPMDTQAEYLLLNRLWNGGQAPWRNW